MKKTLIAFLLFTTLSATARHEPIVVMETAKDIGSEIFFYLYPTRSNTVVKVDFGDSILVEYTLTDEYETDIQGKLKGKTIKIYGSVSDISEIECPHLGLTGLDVSQNQYLKELACNGNRLTALDISQNANLKELKCHNNQLENIDISNNINLEKLDCSNNKLQALDVTHNDVLTTISCKDNHIPDLDLSQNPVLRYLYCSGNQLSTLDLSEKTQVQNINCSNNRLVTLDIFDCKNLLSLYCQNNQLATLSLSNNDKLENINCSNNRLSVLYLALNKKLGTLNCSNNQLSALDISQNNRLYKLDCSNNQLTSLDIKNSDRLKLPNNVLYANNNLDSSSLRVLKSLKKHESNNSYSNSEFGIALDLGYSFKFINKPINQFYIGALAAYSNGGRGYSSYADQFLLGGGAYYGSYNGKKKFIPAVKVGYGGGIGLLYTATITPYSVNPNVSLNFFNIMQFGMGYNIGYRKINGVNMNGISLSINLTLGPGFNVNMSN
ncbi:MAG: hypothetical protein LBU84_00360 [Prevotella sp.]|jgi:hypothetical protein|nr:hypothetical protein [Prevotella sp.]